MDQLRRMLTLVIVALLSWSGASQAAVFFLKARLDGAQAGVSTSADGAGLFSYNDANGQLTWTVTYRNLSSMIVAAHLHGPASPGQDAGVVVPFTTGPSPLTGSAVITPAQASELLGGLWYANIHSANFPNGEIRGQLSLIASNSYRVPMDGAQAGTSGSPIPTSGTGSGTVTLDPATLMMTWNLTFSGLTSPAFAAHFHGPAQPFESAGVVLPTGSTPPVTGSTTLNAAQAAEVVNGFWYFNVHTDNYPLGEIRGQVVPLTSATANPHLANISTRLQVRTGDDVAIAGFVISGSASKTVAVVATGPSLANFGIANPLADPTLTLVRQSDQAVIATNDDWQTAANASQLQAAGLAPSNARESAVLISLPPGAYTAILSGVNNGTGVGLVAVYEVDRFEVPLVNISTRGLVLTGNDVMIGGFIVQGNGPQNVVVTAAGPSLANFGITNALQNPTLQLVRSSDQAVLATNDDWQTAPNAQQIQDAGFAPADPKEPAIMMSLPPGGYTAIVSGASGGTGVGIVAVYTVP